MQFKLQITPMGDYDLYLYVFNHKYEIPHWIAYILCRLDLVDTSEA
jgi:hypothetical protein